MWKENQINLRMEPVWKHPVVSNGLTVEKNGKWEIVKDRNADNVSLPPSTPPSSTAGSEGEVVLAMVLDSHFGSGSRSKPNHCPIGGPGCQ